MPAFAGMTTIGAQSRNPESSPEPSPHMSLTARRRHATRTILLDRAVEMLQLFRLSDSADGSSISYAPPSGGRWRVLPRPGDRIPGTFDQDVYVEVWRRYHEAGGPADGVVGFTLH